MDLKQHQAKNEAANAAVAKRMFPNETWVNADSLKIKGVTIPKEASGIIIAKSKIPSNPQETLDFLKEIKSGIVLKNLGASVTLVPRIRNPKGGFFPGPDAIVNGKAYEFKEVVGTIDKIGARFMDSRRQANNVYIRVANPKLNKPRVMKYMSKLINGKDYNGGYQGNVVFTFGTSGEEQTYFFKISDFKK